MVGLSRKKDKQMTNQIRNICIDARSTILCALKKMDDIGHKLLIVATTDGKFKGLISIGDIQRAIIDILRHDVKVASPDDDINVVKKNMAGRRIEFMPIVDSDGVITDVIFWDDIFKKDVFYCAEKFNLPVVIMAGGEGRRLRPLTNVLPKPLIPIGEKTILEDIMDKFVACGSNDFYLSLNYKADFIRNYMNQLGNTVYRLTYLQEDKPLGTAGSLKLLEKKIHSTFFVSNCDILIDEDYSQILKYHRENNNEITLVTAIKNLSIPYGVVDTTKYGLLKEIKEKPNMSFQINTGLYVLEPHLMEEIPGDTFFHITHLMDKVLKRKGRIGCFPVSEKSWKDIGDWKEYNKFVM